MVRCLNDSGREESVSFIRLIMLGSTPHGDAYTFAEYQSMFANAGFKQSELHQVPPTPASVMLSYK